MYSFQYEDVSAATLASSYWCVFSLHYISTFIGWANSEASIQNVWFVWQETLVPQSEPRDTEMVCAWQGENFKPWTQTNLWSRIVLSSKKSFDWLLFFPAGGDTRLFNSPVQENQFRREEEKTCSKLPPYNRLTWHISTSRTEHPQNAKLCFQFMWVGITFTSRRLCAKMWSLRSKTLWTQISTLFFIGLKICHKKKMVQGK